MSEKLCLQWNSFNENVNSAFGRLRSDKEFIDVTLACEDGKQVEAHKVILASSSPFFEKILQKIKHPHPLIYLKGFQSKDFVSILDFLYFGEANVHQEDLDSFLSIAEEIKLKGLTGQTTSGLIEELEKSTSRPIYKELSETSTVCQQNLKPKENDLNTKSTTLTVPNHSTTDLQVLDQEVKSLMKKGQKVIPNGKNPNGMPKQQRSYICKVCGKEGLSCEIKSHIEANHMEGLSIPCDFCNMTFSGRRGLTRHKHKFHK